MITDSERRKVAEELRDASTGAYRHVDSLDVIANAVGVEVDGKFDIESNDQEIFFDDAQGKRVIIQGGIVVSEED